MTRDEVCVIIDAAEKKGERPVLQWADLKWQNLNYVNFKGADFRCAHFQCADLICANLQNTALEQTNFDSADLRGADLCGSEIDFATFTLWKGLLNIKIDGRIAAQLAYYFCSFICNDPEVVAVQNFMLPLANKYHRIGIDAEKLKNKKIPK